jgi:glycosyltransferase involved in cell wall biosynthesis
MFVITSMPVGGAETLLVNLVRRIDRRRIEPMICCLKEKSVLGEAVAEEVSVFDKQINHKLDMRVVSRLRKLFQSERVDAVITVGAGDKMFWGRIAAKRARVPVVLSALHSTGWPDGIGRLNRMLTPITDGFIACAETHAQFLMDFEKLPPGKVFCIPNGIDTAVFSFSEQARQSWRNKLGIPADSPVVGIVAALREEKNHRLFLQTAASVLKELENTQFVIAGDGSERHSLERFATELNINDHVHFLGTINDIPGVLSMIDLFALTSHNEAKPVSILEAMACQRPVVATHVGSVSESVIHGRTGYLVAEGDGVEMTRRWLQVLCGFEESLQMGKAAREHVQAHSSLDSMTEGYMELVERIYHQKRPRHSAHLATSVATHQQSSVGDPATQG